MTLQKVVSNLLKEGFSGNQIQRMLPNYGYKKRRQDLQTIIREIKGIKKKLSSKPWYDIPQPIIKPRSKTEKWKRAVSTSLRYTNVFYNYYATFFVSWIDAIGFIKNMYVTKFLGLMTYREFVKNKDKVIEKVISEIMENISSNPDYEAQEMEDLQDVQLIEIFRHKEGILRQ